jgi:hypothetical protein
MAERIVRRLLRRCLDSVIVGAALAVVLVLACRHSPQEGFTYGGAGNDRGYAVAQTSDGGYIVAGVTSSFGAGGKDLYLVRTTAAGDTLWTRAYGGAADDSGSSVRQTADGGFVVAGTTGSFGAGAGDVWLLKTNAAGDTVWTRTFGGAQDDIGFSVDQTLDGGYAVCGATLSFGPYNYNVYLVRTDDEGNALWYRTYGGGNDDKGTAVAQTADSGFVIAGFTYSFGAGNYDYYLVKTDALGDTTWTRTFGGAASDQAFSVRQTTDRGFVVAGIAGSFGAGSSDAWLVRTDAGGDTLWTRTFGGTGLDWGLSVAATTDSGFIFTGATGSSGAGGLDVYLVRTSAAGDTAWTRTFGGTEEDKGFAVCPTADGGYVVSGMTKSYGAAGEDVYLVKTNSHGDAEFVK